MKRVFLTLLFCKYKRIMFIFASTNIRIIIKKYMNRKVLLMILDGWGQGRHDYSNAIWTQGTPVIDALREKYPHSSLQACGEYVGLPDGQMGNSEVGHMNLGAGRVVYQDLVKINMAVRDHKFLDNAEIKAVFDYVKTSGKKLHLMGLTSHGGVHSSLDHVYVPICATSAITSLIRLQRPMVWTVR